MKNIIFFLLAGFLVGCATYNVCPVFPKPTQGVLDSIKGLNDPDVDDWMEQLNKHNKKIKICRGECK